MDVFEILKNRRSVRKFLEKPVLDRDIEQIIEAASLSPTARNVQPWEFVVIKDKEKIRAVGDLASPNGALIKGAPACIAVFCQDTKYYLEDGCAATTQALLAAAALGLGSCWVAGDKKDYRQKVGEVLGVPDGFRLISLIALGYADETPHPPKRDPRTMIHKEKF